MSFFEFLGESYNPGPTGHVERRKEGPRPPKNWVVLLWGILAAAALFIALYWILDSFDGNWKALLFRTGFLLLYLIAAFHLRISIPADNIGLWGTPIDHPFRISDDYNRFLVFVEVILLPGRLVSQGLYHFYQLLRQL